MTDHPNLGPLADWMHDTEERLRAIDNGIALLTDRYRAMHDRVAALETSTPPPPIDDLRRWKPPTGRPTDFIWDTARAAVEIRDRFGGDPGVNWADHAAFVDTSEGIRFHSDGAFSVRFDPAARRDSPNTGGANWVNSAMPLANPGTDVELRYTVTMPADLGASIKLPGLQTNTGDQRAPGGGVCGPGQFIARPCISDWNKDGRGLIGPYVYWPTEANAGAEQVNAAADPVRLWHPERSGWSLWWYADPEAVITPDLVVDVSLRVIRTDNGWAVAHQTGNRLITYSYPPGDDDPGAVTHLSAVGMYGGNTAWYGPAAPTTILIENLEVITRP